MWYDNYQFLEQQFPETKGICSSGDRAAVSGTACRGFESLQMRYGRKATENQVGGNGYVR